MRTTLVLVSCALLAYLAGKMANNYNISAPAFVLALAMAAWLNQPKRRPDEEKH